MYPRAGCCAAPFKSPISVDHAGRAPGNTLLDIMGRTCWGGPAFGVGIRFSEEGKFLTSGPFTRTEVLGQDDLEPGT